MDTPPPTPLTPRLAVLRGLFRRCPLCGSRGIFTSWVHQAERCPRCRYPTTRVEDQWIGALGTNTIVSFALLAVAIGVGFGITYPDPPVGVLLTIAVAVAAVFPVAFYPVSKSLWSGIDLAMRPPEPDDDVDPRDLPAARHHER